MGLRHLGTESSPDSLLEGSGFELSVPRQIDNGFEALSETGPSGYRRRGLIRAVAGRIPRLKELDGFRRTRTFLKAAGR